MTPGKFKGEKDQELGRNVGEKEAEGGDGGQSPFGDGEIW